MKRLIALTALVSVGLLAGCNGGSNSSAGNGGTTPPVVPPPVVDIRFETFMASIFAQTNETSNPLPVNDVRLSFSEMPGVFATFTGN